jgi:hypothetical protein
MVYHSFRLLGREYNMSGPTWSPTGSLKNITIAYNQPGFELRPIFAVTNVLVRKDSAKTRFVHFLYDHRELVSQFSVVWGRRHQLQQISTVPEGADSCKSESCLGSDDSLN